MKIGELAKATDVSVRTLHHYDQIGLLTPSQRSEAGHRIYSESDISRLSRVLALRGIGLQLEEIGQILGTPLSTMQATFDRHIEEVENEIAEKTKVLRMLKGARDFIEMKDGADVHEIVSLISEMKVHEEYFSEEDYDFFAKQEEKIGKKQVFAVVNEWPLLIEEAKRMMNEKVPVESEEAQKMVNRWIELKDMFTGGNKGIEAKTKKMIEENPNLMRNHGVDQEVFAYVQSVADHMKKKS